MMKLWYRSSILASSFIVLTSNFTLGEAPLRQALEDYLQRPEPNYEWEIVDQLDSEVGTTYVINLHSQEWLTEDEIDRPLWQHWLLVTCPKEIRHKTAILVISGGDNSESPPTSADSRVLELAEATGAIVAELKNVPNEPLVFKGDGKPRKEDDLIAYAGVNYLKTGDTKWVARFPMIKSGIKAMDTIEALVEKEALSIGEIDDFIVMGASKRGWTTWLVGAMDERVRAIVPMVIDCLNVGPSMRHHYEAYGFWAPALGDYEEHGLLDRTESPEFKALVSADDPHRFRDLITMPKYIMNSAGDQYFLPDSWQFYFDDLVGEKHLSYVPNTDHSLNGSDAIGRVAAFCNSVLAGESRPAYSWEFADDGSIVVTCDTEPSSATLWVAHNPEARDFRLESIGEAYQSQPLQPKGKHRYVAERPEITNGWAAYFVEIEFPQPDGPPLKVTSGIRVTPDELPFAEALEKRRRTTADADEEKSAG